MISDVTVDVYDSIFCYCQAKANEVVLFCGHGSVIQNKARVEMKLVHGYAGNHAASVKKLLLTSDCLKNGKQRMVFGRSTDPSTFLY